MILTYSYKVTFDKIDFDLAGQKKWLVDHVCKNADLKDSLTKAATFRYRYIDVKSRPLGAIEITRGDCG
jgi:hypothetical protein